MRINSFELKIRFGSGNKVSSIEVKVIETFKINVTFIDYIECADFCNEFI